MLIIDNAKYCIQTGNSKLKVNKANNNFEIKF